MRDLDRVRGLVGVEGHVLPVGRVARRRGDSLERLAAEHLDRRADGPSRPPVVRDEISAALGERPDNGVHRSRVEKRGIARDAYNGGRVDGSRGVGEPGEDVGRIARGSSGRPAGRRAPRFCRRRDRLSSRPPSLQPCHWPHSGARARPASASRAGSGESCPEAGSSPSAPERSGLPSSPWSRRAGEGHALRIIEALRAATRASPTCYQRRCCYFDDARMGDSAWETANLACLWPSGLGQLPNQQRTAQCGGLVAFR